jgi:membrane-bound lytic murein transglycosylase D
MNVISTEPNLPAPASGSSGAIYIVRSGDTLNTIAVRFNVTVPAIIAANNLSITNEIRVGQQLVIPKPAMVLRVAEGMAMAESQKPKVGVLGVGDPDTPVVSPREIQEFLAGKRTTFYVTREGDTISRVASLFKVDPLVLSQINQVGMDGELPVGTRLIVPMK